VGIDFVDAAAMEGEYEKAIELCDVLIKKSKDPYEKVSFRIRLAELQGLAGKNEVAQATLKGVIAETGNGSWLEADILRKADSLFERQGDLAGQVAFYKSLYEEHKQRVKVKSQYAFLLAQSNEWDQSKALYKELLLSSPENTELRKSFVQLLANQDKSDEALEQLELMIKQVGGSEDLLLQKIHLLVKLDRKKEVEGVIVQIATLGGSSEADKIRISQLYIQNGLKDQAEVLLKEAASESTAQTSKEALARSDSYF